MKTLAIAALLAAVPAAAQEVIAIVSPAPGPYQAAYAAFVKEFGRPVPAYRLPAEQPPAAARPRVIVAFGGDAALRTYHAEAVVIACLAPGVNSAPHGGRFSIVAMRPPPGELLARLRSIQPGLRRLGILSSGREPAGFTAELGAAATAAGVELVFLKAPTPAQIPDALRSLPGKADALWLAPDPALVTPGAFQTIKQFSWDNGLPFFAPTSGLASLGASAAVSVAAEDAGRRAAGIARRALAGLDFPAVVYADRTHLTINVASAQKSGLSISTEALKAADKVIK